MNKTQLEFYLADLSEETYEELIVKICQNLFGSATHGFAKGRDKGKDAVFRGIARNFPNESHPWDGIIVIQAKHTSSPNVLISEDRNFFNPSSKAAILTQEVKKIATLKSNGELTHYFLATNRKLTGGIEERVIAYIAQESGLNVLNIHIYDSLQTVDFLHDHQDVVEFLNKSREIFQFDLTALKDVINAFVTHEPETNDPLFPEFNRLSYDQKNKINGISQRVAESLAKWYLKYVPLIKKFLSDPRNAELAEKYNLVASQIDLQIASHRESKEDFQKLLMLVCDDVLEKHPIFKKNAQITRALIFYMYWTCDVGSLRRER